MAKRSSTTAFAKSTRPEIGGVVKREALFARLDGTAARTVAWICAPPGFGKTTLAASYLEARNYRWAWYQVDPDDDDGETFFHYLAHAMRRLRGSADALPVFGAEHHGDVAAFARRFFRVLFFGVPGPLALVLDNLHELTAESPLRVVLEAGLAQVPRQCVVMVTSRAAPPLGLLRLLPGGQMVSVSADELRITPAELAEMARLRGQPLSDAALRQLHQHTDGWAAALVLMVEHHKLAGVAVNPPGDATPEVVFDYLAGEIFERFEPSTRRLLLQLACLPRVTIDIARALSGDETAARVLINLAHNDYFVRELVGADGRVFVFHPLLREFLRQRAARDLPSAVGIDALRHAARLLRESGQAEDALTLRVECKDWPEVAAIVAEQADALLGQGRYATLAAWLEVLPPDLLGADAVLLRAHGAALTQLSPRAARRRFEEGVEVARRRPGDAPVALHCCLGVIEAVLREFDDLGALDRWLGEFERWRVVLGSAERVPSVVAVARLWRGAHEQGAHEQGAHEQGAHEQGAHEQDGRGELAASIAVALGGDVARSAAIFDGIEHGTAATALALAMGASLRRLVDGEFGAVLASAKSGLALGAAEATHAGDVWLRLLCAAAALGQEALPAARAELDSIETLALRRGDRAFIHYLRGWLARSEGDPGAALRETRSAALLAVEVGLPWLEALARIAMAQLLADAGDRPGADAQLRFAEALTQRLGSALLRLSILFTQAGGAIGFDEAAAAVPLRAALTLARELGVRHVPGLPPTLLGTLCAVALRRGIAIDHTRLLIGAAGLAPPPAALRSRRWPWAFEITTLGGFGLQRSGEPIEFSAKGPGRPVELLKVLIAMGGQNVRADQLADALWPHVDADYAHKSFTATLHRLRRIFGGDDTLKLSDGRLSLNGAKFWLDTWALEHLLAELDSHLRDRDVHAADHALLALVDEMLALYKGPFLPDEAEQPTYIARREQLRARLLRALTRVARRWEESGHGDAAVDCYQRCIDADELCEAFYRNLMLCYQRHGDRAEALATFERLRAVLTARLKSVPSPETQAIHASLRA